MGKETRNLPNCLWRYVTNLEGMHAKHALLHKKYEKNSSLFWHHVCLPSFSPSSWWFQPVWKICLSKWESSLHIENIFETTFADHLCWDTTWIWLHWKVTNLKPPNNLFPFSASCHSLGFTNLIRISQEFSKKTMQLLYELIYTPPKTNMQPEFEKETSFFQIPCCFFGGE